MTQEDYRGYGVHFTGIEQAELCPINYPLSQMHPNDVSGKTLVTMISPGTELALYKNGTYPFQPGYSAIFKVDAIGSAVDGIAPGDVVFGTGHHSSIQSMRQKRVHLLPAGLSPEKAVFSRFLMVTMATLATTPARPPARVLVSGLGLVGLTGAMLFKECGYEVHACDPVTQRRAWAEESGITTVFEKAPVDNSKFSGTYSLVLECSGHEQAVLDACKVTRHWGEVVLVGLSWERRTEIYAQELLYLMFHQHLTVRSGWECGIPKYPKKHVGFSTHEQYAGAFRWLVEDKIKVSNLYEKHQPQDIQEIYQTLLHQRQQRPGILLDWR